jgi:hypothetical protein
MTCLAESSTKIGNGSYATIRDLHSARPLLTKLRKLEDYSALKADFQM